MQGKKDINYLFNVVHFSNLGNPRLKKLILIELTECRNQHLHNSSKLNII